jgi:DNA-directed RNA polymerase subunit RPC12/RpoP
MEGYSAYETDEVTCPYCGSVCRIDTLKQENETTHIEYKCKECGMPLFEYVHDRGHLRSLGVHSHPLFWFNVCGLRMGGRYLLSLLLFNDDIMIGRARRL